jgi:3-oxoacyl-[acyl-carrier protein] reductase
MSSEPLAGRVALVTGAGSGIGRATAILLAERGARVLALDLNAEGLAATVAGAGGRAMAAVADVRDRAALASAVAAAAKAWGPVDLLMNNAGVSGNNAPLEAIDDAAYERMFGVHVKGALNALQAVVGGMKAKRFGRVVNVVSNRAQVGFHRSSHYAAAKAALLGFTKAWARELAPDGIHVNAVAPGVVRTAMTLAYGEDAVRDEAELNLMKRWAEPSEIAATVAFLMGPEAGFYTGQVMSPNGGDPIVGI